MINASNMLKAEQLVTERVTMGVKAKVMVGLHVTAMLILVTRFD